MRSSEWGWWLILAIEVAMVDGKNQRKCVINSGAGGAMYRTLSIQRRQRALYRSLPASQRSGARDLSLTDSSGSGGVMINIKNPKNRDPALGLQKSSSTYTFGTRQLTFSSTPAYVDMQEYYRLNLLSQLPVYCSYVGYLILSICIGA